MINTNTYIQLQQDEYGTYFIYPYIPRRWQKLFSEEETEISRRIWKYKSGDMNELTLFTNDLMKAVTQVSHEIPYSKIGLVAVPPSKVEKESPVRNSIYNMKLWYQRGETKTYFGCDKIIYDYGRLICRTEDIRTSHYGKRATYEEQKASLGCIRDRLWKYRTAFIILDDITTKGTSMKACRDLLIEHEANEDAVYCLAIAKTIR